MAVMRVVRAKDGDTLCSIAVESGFKNCTKLRADNPDFNARAVRPGDTVKVPEPTLKQEAGQTELHHKFVRLGKSNRVWIIKDTNRNTGQEAIGDRRRELAVSNYVPGRQGGTPDAQGQVFATDLWVDDTVCDFNDGASADPDHFKILIHDKHAADTNQAEVRVTLQAQEPVLGAIRNEIARWNDLATVGTKLDPIVCKRFKPGSAFYRSPYLRLVVDEQDRTCKRRDGRNDPTNLPPNLPVVDNGADVSKQTLLVPPPAERRLEILDLRAQAFRPAPDCEFGAENTPQHCRAQAFVDVGEREKAMRVKVVRIGGQAGSSATDPELRTCIFTNLRRRFAQANVGVKPVVEPGPGIAIVDDFIHDAPLPNNMIMISDFEGLTAAGGGIMRARVRLTSGIVNAQCPTVANATPEQTANALAGALRAQGVTCRVSPNPPIASSAQLFGSCDILCFNADGTPARILSTNRTDARQTIDHTGNWSNANVRSTGGAYVAPRNSDDAMLVGSPEYRAAAKNFITGDTYLCAMVVQNLPGLNGEATGPYKGVVERFRPRPEFQLVVFLSHGGVQSEVTLSHEGGHTVCDCFHTSQRSAAGSPIDRDVLGNLYPNNNALGFSEWMSALPHPNQIRKRISDTPLTVWLGLQRQGVNGSDVEDRLMGGRNAPGAPLNPTCAERFRTLCGSVFENLRRLRPAPQAPL